MSQFSKNIAIVCLATWLGFGIQTATAASNKVIIKVETNKEIARIQPNMYGIFFEDINFGADGGLYAELIKNRSFDFPQSLTGWTAFGDVKIEQESPCLEENPKYARLTLGKSLTGSGLDNEGFKGIGLRKGNAYRLSFYAKSEGNSPLKMRFQLINSGNDNIGKADIEVKNNQWQKYTVILTPGKTEMEGRLRLELVSPGTVCIDHISLFPTDTWMGRENGMRKDLAQALNNLNPGVFRFPGGCIVEGTWLSSRYEWKKTVGPAENRPLNINRWNYTFKHKFFPDYFQTYGLGFFEYFQLCEDFGSDALPILNCGMSCQYETGELVPINELEPYIQDALDLIEFANGDTLTTWGAVRAQMGHPAPFNLKMIGIGNEQWGPEYPERLKLFVKAIRDKYPHILIIGSSGPSADGDKFDYLWPEMKKIGVDLVDEHYYKSPEWFLENAGRYDSYDRKGPKVFAGEYAAHHKSKENNFLSALAEAAFMTGLERNADVVHLATYAPLFAHVNAWQWRPDLIWFDNLNHILTPNYYVQQLYSHNKGTHALQTTSAESDLKGGQHIYATSAIDKTKSQIIIKIVNTSDSPKEITIDLGKNKYKTATEATISTLQSDNLMKTNSFKNPNAITPQQACAKINGNAVTLNADKYSFNVIVIPYFNPKNK